MKQTLLKCTLLIPILLMVSCQGNVSSEHPYDPDLTAFIDSLANAPIEQGKIAGISIGVAKGDQDLFKKGYGYANLDFKVEMPIDAIFEIGSVTKQFTAVAILQLVEQGKLSLEDDFTEYLPFDTRGHKITIRRLLDHTSGIKGYTELPEFGLMTIQDLPRDSLVRLVEDKGFDFIPGEAMIYNNSAYFFLGLIIEQVSGTGYENYIEENLFQPAGMINSSYCSEKAILENKAQGYDTEGGKLIKAGYLRHIWPYAAGSLCSTVSDLIVWNRALHGGKLLSDEMYQELITPGTLNDGTPLRYAKGLTVTTSNGHRIISHGGGIYGFLSSLQYFPDYDLTVVSLMNSTGPVGPGGISNEIAKKILGEIEEPSIEPFSGDLQPLRGTYQGRGRGRNINLIVEIADNTLRVQDGNQPYDTLSFAGDFSWKSGNTYYEFKKNDDLFNELRINQVGGHYVLKRE